MSPTMEECQYVNSMTINNRDKNRYTNVLPGMYIYEREVELCIDSRYLNVFQS